jgi:hypothetical protein
MLQNHHSRAIAAQYPAVQCKADLIWRHSWETRCSAEMAIFPRYRLQANDCRSMEYINGFYNPRPSRDLAGNGRHATWG